MMDETDMFTTQSLVTSRFDVRQTLSVAKLSPEATELIKVLKEKDAGTSQYKCIVAQTAPAVRVAFSELFGYEPGALKANVLVASLKAIGFDLVLDTNTAADLTICEESQELLHRVMARKEPDGSKTGMPLFSSCCPGWMKFVNKSEVEIIPHLSTCKSPHMMYGAVLKRLSKELIGCEPHEIYICSVMPCVLKKTESDAPIFVNDGVRDLDNVITTKDVGVMLRIRNIDPLSLEPKQYDSPFQVEEVTGGGSGLGTGAGQLFGSTGGVTEAVVRSIYEIVTGSKSPRLELSDVRGLDEVREAVVPLYSSETGRGLDKVSLRVAVVYGLGNAKKLLERIKSENVSYDFVEVMACPGGCISGGGQPLSKDKNTIRQRQECIYNLDKTLPIRRSHENPIIRALYERHLGGNFGSLQAKDMLHVQQVYGGRNDPEDDTLLFGCDQEVSDLDCDDL